MISTFSVYGFAFLFASFTILPISEKATGAKHQQWLAGVRPEVYWASNMVADFIVCGPNSFLFWQLRFVPCVCQALTVA